MNSRIRKIDKIAVGRGGSSGIAPPSTPSPIPTPSISPTPSPTGSPNPPSPDETLLDLYKKEPDVSKKKKLIPAIGEIKTDNAFILLASELRKRRDVDTKRLLIEALKKQGPEANQIILDADKKEVCLNEKAITDDGIGVFNLKEPVIKKDKIKILSRPWPLTQAVKVYVYKEAKGWVEVPATSSVEKVARRTVNPETGEMRITVYDERTDSFDRPDIDLKKGFILSILVSNKEYFIGKGGTVLSTLDEAKANPLPFIGPVVCDLNSFSDKYKLVAPESVETGSDFTATVNVDKGVSPPPQKTTGGMRYGSHGMGMTINFNPLPTNQLLYTTASWKVNPPSGQSGITVGDNGYITTAMGGQVATTIIGNPDLGLDKMNFIDPNVEPIARAFEEAFPELFKSVGSQKVVAYVHENPIVPDTRKISFSENEHAVHEDGEGLAKELNLGTSNFVSSISYSLCSAGKASGGKRNIASASFDIELYSGGNLVDSKSTDWRGEKYSGDCPDAGSFLFNKLADRVKVTFREKDKDIDYATHYGDVSINSYQFDSKSKGLEMVSFAIDNGEIKSAYFGGISNPTITISTTKNFLNHLRTLDQKNAPAIITSSIINKEIIIADSQGNNLFKNIAGSTDKAPTDFVNSVLGEWSIGAGESKKIIFGGDIGTLRAVNYNSQTIRFVVTYSKPDRGEVIISAGIPTDVCIVNPDSFPSGMLTGQSSIVDCSSLDQQIIPMNEFGPPAPSDFFFSGVLAGSTSSQEQYQMLYFNGPQIQELSPGSMKIANVKGVVLSSGDMDLPEEKSFKMSFEKSGSEEEILIPEKSFLVDKVADKLKITSRSPAKGMAKIFYSESEIIQPTPEPSPSIEPPSETPSVIPPTPTPMSGGGSAPPIEGSIVKRDVPPSDFTLTVSGKSEINEGENEYMQFSGAPAGEDGKVTYYFDFGSGSKTNADGSIIQVPSEPKWPTETTFDDKRTPEQILQYGGQIAPVRVNIGAYTTSILAVSASGKKAYADFMANVKNVPPTASAIVYPASGSVDRSNRKSTQVAVGQAVQFNGGGSYAGDYDRIFYYWDFDSNDGLSFVPDKEKADKGGEDQYTEHSYTKPETYTATLRVYDDDGSYADDKVTVIVT